MNRESPATYVESSTEVSIENTKKLMDYIRSLSTLPTSSPLVSPIITPRFAIFCTEALLKSLGAGIGTVRSDVSNPDSHIGNAHEIESTLSLFPDVPDYAGVYDVRSMGPQHHHRSFVSP